MDYATRTFLLAIVVFANAAAAAASRHAADLPTIVGSSRESPVLLPVAGHSRREKVLRLSGIDASRVKVWGPDGGSGWLLPVIQGKTTVKTRGPRRGGYHWVGVREVRGRYVDSANTVLYFSNPGPAPRGMLTARKSELDILPVELPREHRHYRAGERWDFLVRLHGEPLPGASVRFVSRNGTRERLRTDARGLVSVVFPSDFADLPEPSPGHGHRGRRKAGFVLSVSHDDGESVLNTSFNYHYIPGAYYNKDLRLGIGFAVLGMVAATPLIRRRDKETRS